MISNDPFVSVFGSSSNDGSGLDRLPWIAAFAVKQGFAVVVIEPGGKKPMCTLTARQVNQADREAREAAAESGDRHADRRRHACGINHAITDPAKAMAVVKRMMATHGKVNIGVELGRSRMIVVDVDTEAEKAAFQRDLQWFGSDSATCEPTVQSPGKRNAEGVWTHSGGGHYWFRPPDDWEPGGSGVCKVTNEAGSYTILWSDRQVLVPPSVRPEGPYRLTAPPMPLPTWLAGKIAGSIAAHEERKQRTFDRLTGGDASSIDVWSAGRPWDELLLPDGWTPTGLLDSCSCPTWTRPGDWSNPKSATAHEPGCTVYDTDLGSGPLHVWTDSPPEYLVGTGGTLTKIQYISARYHGGNIAAALGELGISQEGGPSMGLEFEAAYTVPSLDASETGEDGPEEDECPFMAAGAPVPVEPIQRPAGAPEVDEDTEAEAARIEAEEAAGAGDALEQPPPGQEPPGWKALQAKFLTSAQAREMPPPEWLVEDVLPWNAVTRVIGKSGDGKSWVALDLACRVATGQPWGTREVRQGLAVYLVAEGQQGWFKRLHAWEIANNGGEPLGPDQFRIIPFAVQTADDVAWLNLRKALKDLGPTLVVFDTQARITVGVEENSATEMGVILQKIDLINTDNNAAVMVVHHVGHQGEHGRGTTALLGAMAAEILVAKRDEYFEVINKKQKDGEEFDTIIGRLEPVDVPLGDGDTWPSAVFVLDGTGMSPPSPIKRGRPVEHTEDDLLAIVAGFGADGCTASMVVTPALDAGMSRATAYRLFRSCVDSKMLTLVVDTMSGEIKSGRYRVPLRSV